MVHKQVMAAAMMEISLHSTPVKKTNHQVKAGAETKAEYLVEQACIYLNDYKFSFYGAIHHLGGRVLEHHQQPNKTLQFLK